LQHLPPEEAILILRRILKSWHIQQQRGADRQNRPRRVAIALGVTSIHHYLQTLAIQNESSSDSSFSVILNGNLGADYAPQHKSFECMQVDQSASGVALQLQLQLSQSSSPQVGQLLLITASEDENSSDWRIGVVRRAMRKGNSSLELGVQFIRGHVSPITLRTPNKGKEEQPGRRALFIDRGHKHRGSVIVSRNSLELDQGYRVDEQTPDPVIVPMQLAEATPGFARYRLKDT
ncbi:flavoprotein, partial [Candidatus Endoriftia persephone str. Guaymas]|nr:flavoprotein [Candidatus Endoriftia persephone str. Guaymas]